MVTNANDAAASEQPNESTLNNLSANIANVLAAQQEVTDAEQNAPSAVPASNQEPVTPEQVEETPATEVPGTEGRIKKENAALRAAMMKIGIDPDSDMVDQLREGFVTIDDILTAKRGIQPQQPVHQPEQPKANIPLSQKLGNLKESLQRDGDVDAREYRQTVGQMLEIIEDLGKDNERLKQTTETQNLQQMIDQITNTTKAVFNEAVKFQIPPEVKSIAEEMFFGATDVQAGYLARDVGREKAITPQGYRFVASKLAPQFEQFCQSIYNAGRKSAGGKVETPTAKSVTAFAPGSGGGTPAPRPDKSRFDINKLNTNVNEFLAGTQSQV